MDTLFAFKKMIGVCLSPLPLISLLFVIGLYFVCRKNQNMRLGCSCLVLSLVTLLMLSSPIVSALWVNSFEEYVPPYQDHLKSVDNIVVLGCYNSEDPQLPMVANIHECSLYRLIEAKRLSLIYPQAKIILTGMKETDARAYSHPEYSAKMLKSIGVAKHRIVILNNNKDTESEAESLAPVIKQQVNLVVSSATHFRRIEQIFSKLGIVYTAVPSEYLSVSQFTWNWRLLLPSVDALKASERAMYESLGNAWISIKKLSN